MKTKLFLFAALFITTITFSQTSKKGYDHCVAASHSSASKKMNKAELIDAVAKDANLRKRPGRTGRNPQTGKAIKNARNTNGLPTGKRTYEPTSKTKVEYQDGTDLHVRKRPGRTKYGTIISTEGQAHRGNDKPMTKRPGRTQGYPIPGIDITIEQGKQKNIRKKPGSKIARDYNSSRSNRRE